MQTGQSDGERPAKKYNPIWDDLIMNKTDLQRIAEDLVGLEEITASQELDIVDDQDNEWLVDRSKVEVEIDDEQQQLSEPACLGVVKRNDVIPQENQGHDSRCRPRVHDKHQN